MTYEMIARQVLMLIQTYATTDPYELCDYLNIHVEKEPLGKINGYYMSYEGVQQIRLNTALDPYTMKLKCCHELAHAILHPDLNLFFLMDHTFFVLQKYENEADLFAEILMGYNQEIPIC